jgi:hypothetical protein
MRKETIIEENHTAPPEPIDAPIIHTETESFMNDGAELEKFMNEPVQIIVFSGGREGDIDIIAPEVNGQKFYIERNKPTWVKRSIVEILARAKTTTYGQEEFSPTEKKSLQLIPRTSHSYPFQVVQDRNPMGPAWLQAISKQR